MRHIVKKVFVGHRWEELGNLRLKIQEAATEKPWTAYWSKVDEISAMKRMRVLLLNRSSQMLGYE